MTARAERFREALLQRYPRSSLERVVLSNPSSTAPSLPADYLEFLAGVGWGSLDGRYMFYSGPLDPDEVFEAETASGLVDVILIGDNYSGDILGYAFRAGSWFLTELDHTAPERIEPESSADLFAFVERRFLRP